MGRLAGLVPKVRISTRLTWTFSASTVPARSAATRRRAPVSAAGLRASAALLGSVLRAARSRTPPVGRTRDARRG
ncbi:MULTISPECIES: hypothetical protein [unclassified Streptomyces]|uniref:hypothetical protein n=1 Tax=unclassified Streptomyces TaxID=2593676 RepID=UPI000526168B|nr:hypothetical protein [Streptomyces sp. NRRL F-525]